MSEAPSPDDVDADAAQNAAEEAADAFESMDDSKISRLKRLFFQAWLVAVFGGSVALLAVSAYVGFLSFDLTVVATIDLSGPLETLAQGIVYLLLATTVIAILVVAPAQILSTIARAVAAYDTPDENE
jgi:hypothetical protein